MDNINKKKRLAKFVVCELKKLYPDAKCSLEYSMPHELLIAARLSAQCTDARVNLVTPALFKRFPTLEAFARADYAEVEEMIRSCGLYRTKAKSIVDLSRRLVDVYDGAIPDTIDELLTLPGIGRKTANLILGDVFGKPAIVTDTHCIRICGRIGLSSGKEPAAVERQLREIIEADESSEFCHRLVLFGRDICPAPKPKCGECPIAEKCKYAAENHFR